MLLAFDDTDGARGGCTTHLAHQLLAGLQRVDLIGPPRLVRLNPNIPHKTRGNGAVCLRLGHGAGAPQVVGHAESRVLVAYPDGEELTPGEAENVEERARNLIEEEARWDDPRTHPGLVVTRNAPSPSLYWSAVRRYVGQGEARAALAAAGGRLQGWRLGRGVVGAAAAAAWPGKHGTFEWMSYRDRARWGTRRDLDPALGPEMNARHPSSFDNYDPRHDHLRIAPASPCPVLAGVRGTRPEDLRAAIGRLRPETPAGTLLFATNQATDDHLVPQRCRDLRPYVSATLEVTITKRPISWKGGHVFVRAHDASGPVDLAAFEPVKEFRDVVRSLHVGDIVRAHGSVQEDPTLLALEKLEVLQAEPRERVRAPTCHACGRATKSRGAGQGYRCPRCRARYSAGQVHAEPAPAGTRYEAPVSVRRHLARPWALTQLAKDLVA